MPELLLHDAGAAIVIQILCIGHVRACQQIADKIILLHPKPALCPLDVNGNKGLAVAGRIARIAQQSYQQACLIAVIALLFKKRLPCAFEAALSYGPLTPSSFLCNLFVHFIKLEPNSKLFEPLGLK